MKESDWLLKNFHQSENGLQSYHGEQNRGYHLKEQKKSILETGVKSDVAFCLGSSIEKTNSGLRDASTEILKKYIRDFQYWI